VAARACGLVSLEPTKVIKKGTYGWIFSVISFDIIYEVCKLSEF
jgi:hypothetical protein